MHFTDGEFAILVALKHWSVNSQKHAFDDQEFKVTKNGKLKYAGLKDCQKK